MDTDFTENKIDKRLKYYSIVIGIVAGVLTIIILFNRVVPIVSDFLATIHDTWVAPTEIKQLKSAMRQLADTQDKSAWRDFRIEQRLQIQDDPPKRLQFDWETSQIITNDINFAFLKNDTNNDEIP